MRAVAGLDRASRQGAARAMRAYIVSCFQIARLAATLSSWPGGTNMKPRIGFVSIAMTLWPLVVSAQQPAAPVAVSAESFPAWAYPWAPDFKSAPDDGVPRHVPDSDAAFTITQERDLFFVPDWHPGDHPRMPDIVGQGRRAEVRACGSCHRASGTGGPENASLAGLPATYIRQ